MKFLVSEVFRLLFVLTRDWFHLSARPWTRLGRKCSQWRCNVFCTIYFRYIPHTNVQAEIDDSYAKCREYDDATKDANNASDKNDIDIRDVGKKVTKMETKMEEILEQLQASTSKMEQLDAGE